jgi:cytochrome c553
MRFSHTHRRAGATALLALFTALPAAADDAMSRRALACTGCHGERGRAGPDGYYPRIAGKPAVYLHEQLLAFRDGRRRYALMTHLLEPLSDAYLLDLARHFAALDLPYAPPPPATAPAQRLAHGQRLATHGDPARELPACTACHGEHLTGALPATPALLGLPRDYLNAQLGAWREGSRQARAPDCMAEVARRLTPEDIGALSAWLSSQPLPPAARPAAEPPPASLTLPLRCGSGAPWR